MINKLLSIGKKGARLVFRPTKKVPRSPKKILIFKIGALGDVLMTTPFVRALRFQYPKSTIDYLVGSWSAPVLQNNPHIDTVHTFEDKIFFDMKIPVLLKLAKKMRAQKYDLVIVLDKSYTFGCFARLFGAPTVGFNRNREGFMHSMSVPYGDMKHDITYNLDLAKKLGCKKETENVALELFPTDQEKIRAKKLWKQLKIEANGKKVIGLSPGGGTNPGQSVLLKRWPKFSELAQKLLDQGHEVLVFGGKSDMSLHSEMPKGVKSVIGKTTIGETSVLMSMCETIITNDSGPMHVASAMANKVIAIFGPTDPKKLGPLGKGRKALWKKNTKCPPCNPKGRPACYQDGKFPQCPTHACMEQLSVDEVIEILQNHI